MSDSSDSMRIEPSFWIDVNRATHSLRIRSVIGDKDRQSPFLVVWMTALWEEVGLPSKKDIECYAVRLENDFGFGAALPRGFLDF